MPSHTRAECHSCHSGLEAQNKVIKRKPKISMTDYLMVVAHTALTQYKITAAERHRFWLPISTYTIVTSPTAISPTLVVHSGASHNMRNNRSLFISYRRLPLAISIKLGDDLTVTATYHVLVHITQDLQLDALYNPTFRLSLLSISQLEHARNTRTF